MTKQGDEPSSEANPSDGGGQEPIPLDPGKEPSSEANPSDGGGQEQGLDLAKDEEPSPKGNQPNENGLRTPESVRQVAIILLGIFGVCLFMIIYLVFSMARDQQQDEILGSVMGFYGSILSMLGTLMGGLVAFYFTRDSSITLPARQAEKSKASLKSKILDKIRKCE